MQAHMISLVVYTRQCTLIIRVYYHPNVEINASNQSVMYTCVAEFNKHNITNYNFRLCALDGLFVEHQHPRTRAPVLPIV